MKQLSTTSNSLFPTFSYHRRPSHAQYPVVARPLLGFTIVELLVVIVVISILATLTVLAYNGIRQRAVASSLSSDLDSANKKLLLYQVDNGAYPTTNDCSVTPAANSICLQSSGGSSYLAYQVNNAVTPQTFCLTATNSHINYKITNTSGPAVGQCSGILSSGAVCPPAFIAVPGSSTYGTADFCVMKYEAKQSSSTVPISQASGAPWTSISQTDALAYSQNVVGCTGCHLITEAEWLTLAQNVLGVASNWSGGAVGSGYIYSGHNDNAPASPLAADTNDANGYSGETNTGGTQRRTLTLTNGEVIWDFAGNVWEWTSGVINSGGQPGISGGGYAFREWNGLSVAGSLSPNPYPSYATSIASSWTSTQGIGQVFSSADDNNLRGFLRSGSYQDGSGVGVTVLDLFDSPGAVNGVIGFRVTR